MPRAGKPIPSALRMRRTLERDKESLWRLSVRIPFLKKILESITHDPRRSADKFRRCFYGKLTRYSEHRSKIPPVVR
jgi:hypothetical protein